MGKIFLKILFALYLTNMTAVEKQRCLPHAHIVDVALFESQKMAMVTDNIHSCLMSWCWKKSGDKHFKGNKYVLIVLSFPYKD